ncbi:hypothetical protein QQ045_003359 [Rhodiola kirilowii]
MGDYRHDMNKRVEQERAKLMKSQSDLSKNPEDTNLIEEEARVVVPVGNISFDSNQIRVGFLEHFKNILNGSFVGSHVDIRLFEEGPKVDEAECAC